MAHVEHIVIAGGGTAGWMAAAALSKMLKRTGCRISLVESPTISTIGVGEATIPPILAFNQMLGIDEKEFMMKTQATFKLGIEFSDWAENGTKYIHGFGAVGLDSKGLEFYNYWHRWQQWNRGEDIGDCSLVVSCARKNKFIHPDSNALSILKGMKYAYHIDAGLYAAFLKELAVSNGVNHISDDITEVKINPDNSFISSLKLKNGTDIKGDFFIDCTGFPSLLLGGALKVPYVSWRQWLLCDSAIAAPSARQDILFPYTKATAHGAGWSWCIPLQHRTGNGVVYSSKHLADQEAISMLSEKIHNSNFAEPKILRFVPGRRERMWEKNCLAIGLASGFIEPLESTSIHLIQSAIIRLSRFLPQADMNQLLIEKYNYDSIREIEEIRDFIILHYVTTKRSDSAFWRECARMDIPDTLSDKINLYVETGRVFNDPKDVFTDQNWIAVLLGQGVHPKNYHPIAECITTEELNYYINKIKSSISSTIEKIPDCDGYLKKFLNSQY